MWIVNLSLRRPYTVWVGMLLITVLGWLGYTRTPTDILPTLKVPVVVVFASYRGMPAPDMEQTVTSVLERALTKCDHLEHIESRSMLGIGIIKVYFRPHVDGDLASSQVVALVASEMQNLPPGMLPPTIMKYDATSVPVGNLVLSSSSRDDKFLLDLAEHGVRDKLAGIEGLAPAPVFGGVFRQIQVFVHPRTLESMHMSPMDVARLLNAQSQVIPTGELRIGKQNYYVSSNSMAATQEDFAKIPLYADGRKVVRLGDVADIQDDQRWRTNIVHVEGTRAVYMPLLRQAGSSAVDVVDNVKDFLPKLKAEGVVPEDVEVEVAFDQSQYVRDALANLNFEGVLGAVLASLVVLLFLGSLRSTLIVALAIPLSVFFAFTGLYFSGQTLNIMTLGGLALVLGRVVDDSIVDVENTVRHLNMGKSPHDAALDSAREIAVPVLMATITTVIVLAPLALMSGVAKYLFTPLAISASLAMFASYIVSRTVSPVCCARWLKPHTEQKERMPRWLPLLGAVLGLLGLAAWLSAKYFPMPVEEMSGLSRRLAARAYRWLPPLGVVGLVLLIAVVLFRVAPAFDRLFERFTNRYQHALTFCLRRPLAVAGILIACLVPAVFAFLFTGQEMFPEVDSSDFTVHLRATGGPRVEETERKVEEIEKMLTAGHPADFHRLVIEVFLALSGRDRAYVDAIAEANRADGGDRVVRELTDAYRIKDSDRQRAENDRIGATIGKRKFHIPPVIPEEDQDLVVSNIGLSSRWGAIYTPNNGPHAAFVRVQLRSGFAGRHTPVTAYVSRLRRKLQYRWPTYDFFFETGGMIRRILNAGAVAPVEVQIFGHDNAQRREVARLLNREIGQLASVQDTYLPQGMDLPQLKINVDRIKAARPGLTEADVIRNVITALMSSAQIAPNFWIDPKSGNPYVIGVQFREHMVENIQTLEKIPLTATAGTLPRSRADQAGNGSSRSREEAEPKRPPVLRLEDVATIERTQGPIEVYHQKVSRVSQLFVNPYGNDLARLASDVSKVVAELPMTYALSRLPDDKLSLAEDAQFRKRLEEYVVKGGGERRRAIEEAYGFDPQPLRLPKDVHAEVVGEASLMASAFQQMGISMALAVLFVYLIMVAQFQSWLDPLIMIVAAPLGLIGVAWILWLTGTTLNIQSLMGILMMVGISVSNSVLLVEFANEKLREGHVPTEAVTQAAVVRLRPILMTSVATVFGLLPMALHREPGDEMNLPLARAVIGGLLSSTLLTLFAVPVLYVWLKKAELTTETPRLRAEEDPRQNHE